MIFGSLSFAVQLTIQSSWDGRSNLVQNMVVGTQYGDNKITESASCIIYMVRRTIVHF